MGYTNFFLPLLLLLHQRISCGSDPLEYNQSRTKFLEATYGRNTKVLFGNILRSSATSSQPSLKWRASSSSLYTVMMIDVDAPSRRNPYLRDYMHWLVVNVPGNDIYRGNTSASYLGPGPPKGTGLHRYFLLVYKQPKALAVQNITERANFNTTNFAIQFGLNKPVARNFFRAKYEGK